MAITSEVARQNGLRGGRPKGAVTSRKTQLFNHYVSQLMAESRSPGHVMIQNMLFWAEETGTIKDALEKLLKTNLGSLEARQRVISLMELYGTARRESQKCAVDAAPYCMPRLQAVAITQEPSTGIDDLSHLTDDKLAEIVTRGITAAMDKREAGMLDVTPNKGAVAVPAGSRVK